MKLLYCEKCDDIFKLSTDFIRSCACGRVIGKYLPDGGHAVVNGKGFSIAMDNNSLAPALNDIARGADRRDVVCWVRKHSGPLNKRTTVDKTLKVPFVGG